MAKRHKSRCPTQQSTLLKVEPKSRSADADTYKFTNELFEGGDVKDLIRFLNTFEEISNNKPLSTANSKFAFFKTMLTGAALENGMTQFITAPGSPKQAKTGPKWTHRAKQRRPSRKRRWNGKLRISRPTCYTICTSISVPELNCR